MTAERWARVHELYHAARLRTDPDSGAILAEACTDDEALRREVQARRDQPVSTGGFVETQG